MRFIGTVLLLFVCLLSSSCTSEYDERLEEAKILRDRLLLVEESNFISPNRKLINEMHQLETEIHYLAKVSGNEEMFLQEIKEY